jgi:hypothetical protein
MDWGNLVQVLVDAGKEMSGIGPSQRLMGQITGGERPEGGFGLNRGTVDWVADLISNVVGVAGPALGAAKMAPGVGRVATNMVMEAPRRLADESGLFRFAKPEEIKPGSNAFSALWDKKPRVEISDDLAKIKEAELSSFINNPKRSMGELPRLKQVFEHDDLLSGNKQLSEMKAGLSVDPVYGTGEGHYEPSRGYIPGRLFASGKTGEELKETTIHELQHALQEQGGLARGTNPAMAGEEAYNKFENQINKQIRELYKEVSAAESMKEAAPYLKEIERLQKNKMKIMDTIYTDQKARHGFYLLDAGEFEARDAASRMNLTPEQRITTPPYSSENIPLEDLIVR